MLASFHSKNTLEAGCDEAGRGCLAGPVFASAVILTQDYFHEDLNDSKQLSRKKRERLRIEIEANAIAWAIGIADNNEIDEINILNASYLAMHRAIEQLKPQPQSFVHCKRGCNICKYRRRFNISKGVQG